MEEMEIVPYQQVEGMEIFINKLEYRAPHFHPEWELLWVLDTPLSITSAQKQYLFETGELILFPPNYPHEFHKMERTSTFLCMQISSRQFFSTANLHTDEIRLANCLSKEDDRWLRQTMIDIARACWTNAPYFGLYCMGQCGLVLHRLLSCVPSHVMSQKEASSAEQRNGRLARLIQFVDENYMHRICLSDFARQEGCSVSCMSHFVKDTMNQTFQDYVNSVRFNCARKLIAAGNDSLVSICAESGFSDYRYFSRAFQEAYGMTPSEYSQQAQLTLVNYAAPVQSLHSREEILTMGPGLNALKAFETQLAQRS